MNVPTKLTFSRIIITICMIIILLFPFYRLNLEFPMLRLDLNEVIEVDTKYIICGVLFLIASFTDFLDGYLARKNNMVTDFGKFIDAIADKVLVNSMLIIFATNNMISPIIAVAIVFRDIVVDAIRMFAASKGSVIAAGKTGKIKTIFMMLGITFTFFYNLPFEIWNVDVASVFLIIATVLSIYSGFEYYYMNKKVFK